MVSSSTSLPPLSAGKKSSPLLGQQLDTITTLPDTVSNIPAQNVAAADDIPTFTAADDDKKNLCVNGVYLPCGDLRNFIFVEDDLARAVWPCSALSVELAECFRTIAVDAERRTYWATKNTNAPSYYDNNVNVEPAITNEVDGQNAVKNAPAPEIRLPRWLEREMHTPWAAEFAQQLANVMRDDYSNQPGQTKDGTPPRDEQSGKEFEYSNPSGGDWKEMPLNRIPLVNPTETLVSALMGATKQVKLDKAKSVAFIEHGAGVNTTDQPSRSPSNDGDEKLKIIAPLDIQWPLNSSFTVSNGTDHVRQYIATCWSLSPFWLFEIFYLQSKMLLNKTLSHWYEVVFTTPTRRRPHSAEQVAVFFTIDVDTTHGGRTQRVRVQYQLETQSVQLEPSRFRFREAWLEQVLLAKYKSNDEWVRFKQSNGFREQTGTATTVNAVH